MSEYYEHMSSLNMERERLYCKGDIEKAYQKAMKETPSEDDQQRMKINNARKFLVNNLEEFIKVAQIAEERKDQDDEKGTLPRKNTGGLMDIKEAPDGGIAEQSI